MLKKTITLVTKSVLVCNSWFDKMVLSHVLFCEEKGVLESKKVLVFMKFSNSPLPAKRASIE